MTLPTKPSLWMATVGAPPRYEDERFGIEVEAEGLPASEYARMRDVGGFQEPLLAATSAWWVAKGDGSLRHNGVEFVTHPIVWENVSPAIELLWDAFDEGLVRTSVRAGIHVHYNVAHMSPLRFMRLLQTYALAEPLLFQMVGPEREQNIYCVPWYMGDGEQETVQEVLACLRREGRTEAYATLLQTCKYSALFCGPVTSFGTVEYRMAPTFKKREDMHAWLRVVRAIGQNIVDPHDPDAGAKLLDLLSAAWGKPLDAEAYYATLEDYDVIARAAMLQPCTYKVESWGQPASMAFGETKKLASPLDQITLSARTRRAEFLIMDEFVERQTDTPYEDYISDEEEE